MPAHWPARLVLFGLIALCVGLRPTAQGYGYGVQNSRGVVTMGEVFHGDPYKPGTLPNLHTDNGADGRTDVRDSKGRVVSGFAYYGWREGIDFRVVVLAVVPLDGAENRYYEIPTTESLAKMRLEEIARYTLTFGERRSVNELKTFGLLPVTLVVTPAGRGR